MPYCSECGVELEKSAHSCPLCGTRVHSHTPPPGEEQGYADSDDIEDFVAQRPSDYGRRLAVQILTVVCVTPALITAVVDWMISGRLTWSLYVCVAMAAAWVYSVVPVFFYRKLLWILVICILMTGVLMWAVDMLDERAAWFWDIGMPLMAVIVVVTSLVTGASLLSRRRGANIAAFVLFGLIGLSMAVDGISKRYMDLNAPLLSWSLIVAAALGPVAIFLLYYHHVLAREINLRKQLHL